MKQAVILAAGEGKRLRPFTVTKPKAMLSIAGKPILQYVVESLAENGVRQIILVVGYCREQIFDWMGAGERLGVDITYVTQEKRLGTAHALKQAESLTDDEFLVLAGDKLIDAGTIAQFVTTKPEAMLVKRVTIDNSVRYGAVTVEKGRVKGIIEKPREAQGSLISTGIYIFTSEVFGFIGAEADIPDVLNKMLAQGVPISAVEVDGTWLDVVYPWDILSLNGAVLGHIQPSLGGTIEAGVQIKGLVSVGENTVIRSNCYITGPVVIGHGCQIGPGVAILPATSIGDNVVISSFSEIANSVIGNDVSLGSGSIIQNSVIDKGCLIKGHFTASSGSAQVEISGGLHLVNMGAMLGAGCHLDSNVVAQPGVILGNYSQIRALKVISGRLPDRSLIF